MNLEQLRAALKAAIEAVEKLAAVTDKDGNARPLTSDELKDLNAKTAEIDNLEENIKALTAVERAKALKATPADEPVDGGTPKKPAKAARGKKDRNEQSGSKFGRSMICMWNGGKGKDPEAAAKYAEDRYGDEELAMSLREVTFESKSMTSGNDDAGGSFVPPDVSSDIIMPLRARSAIRRMNPTIIDMPRGTVDLPAMLSGVNGQWVGEAQHQNAEQGTTGVSKLVWKKERVIIPISKELLRFGGAGIEATIQRDTVRGLANTEDLAFIRGLGTEYSPRGIRYQAASDNVFASAGTTAAQVEADMQKVLEKLEGKNVDVDDVFWLMSSRSRTFLGHVRDANGNKIYPEVNGNNPMLYSARVGVTNNIPNTLSGNESEIYYASAPDIVIGQAIDMQFDMTDQATYHDVNGNMVSAWDRDEVVLKIVNWVDIILRYPEAVSVITGVTYGA